MNEVEASSTVIYRSDDEGHYSEAGSTKDGAWFESIMTDSFPVSSDQKVKALEYPFAGPWTITPFDPLVKKGPAFTPENYTATIPLAVGLTTSAFRDGQQVALDLDCHMNTTLKISKWDFEIDVAQVLASSAIVSSRLWQPNVYARAVTATFVGLMLPFSTGSFLVGVKARMVFGEDPLGREEFVHFGLSFRIRGLTYFMRLLSLEDVKETSEDDPVSESSASSFEIVRD